MADIVRLHLKELESMLKENNISIEVTDKAVQWLANAGYEPEFGARPLKRVIQRNLVNDLSRKILAGDVKDDHRIKVDVAESGKLTFEPMTAAKA
jgi:ATP-dependent Clp protease ATP-binding subunit ClpB